MNSIGRIALAKFQRQALGSITEFENLADSGIDRAVLFDIARMLDQARHEFLIHHRSGLARSTFDDFFAQGIVGWRLLQLLGHLLQLLARGLGVGARGQDKKCKNNNE